MAHLVHGFNRRFLGNDQNQPLLTHEDGHESDSDENGLFDSDSKGYGTWFCRGLLCPFLAAYQLSGRLGETKRDRYFMPLSIIVILSIGKASFLNKHMNSIVEGLKTIKSNMHCLYELFD